MANQDISIRRLIVKYGLLLGVIWSIYVYIRLATGNQTTINWFSPIIEIIIHSSLIYPIYLYKSSNNGFLKLSDALKIGIGISLIVSSVYEIFNFVLSDIIQSEFIQQTLNNMGEEMLINNPNMSPLEIQEAIRTKAQFDILFRFVLWLIVDFLISLIAGAFMYKKTKL